MLVYVPKITPRIEFIMRIILKEICGIEYKITRNLNLYHDEKGVKFAYAPQPVQSGLWVQAYPLLFENDIRKQTINPVLWNDLTLFFPTNAGDFPIDFFALSFYLITRYEEYDTTVRKDQHGRFPVQESVAYRLGFHRKPVVNMLAKSFAEKIKEKYPAFTFSMPPFHSVITYDIDIAYRYRGKIWYRWIGAFVKSVVKFQLNTACKLLQCLFTDKIEDSYNQFNKYQKDAKQNNQKPICFMLTAPFGKFDKNINPKGKAFSNLIKKLKTFSEIGIHPSYYSMENDTLISKEKQQLERIADIKITKSRQHFLRLVFPDTFRALTEAGIKEDYSLGWQDEAGFRMSTTIPCPFFDLVENRETLLILHSLAVMDSALFRCGYTDEECKEILISLRKEVEDWGGEFIVLVHNSSERKIG